jgi:large subunit ribosomal protein L6
MSRIGKQIITIPKGTEVKISGGLVSVKGPKGSLAREFPKDILVNIKGDEINLVCENQEDRKIKALWGTYASHLKNMIIGVNEGYVKKLILEGVGFKSEISGKTINLALGFSHPVKVEIPENLTVTAEKNNITVGGIDKELVGRFAAELRAKKKPEPYKGKGFRYIDEVIRRKQGKKAS